MDPADWQIVREAPLFAALSREVMEDLAESHGARVYEKGTLLFEQGTPIDHFYVVLDGWVKVFRATPDGAEIVVHLFRRGETFAEAGIFMGGRYPVSAETATTCRLLRISGRRLRDRLLTTPDLALAMLASTSQHLKVLVDQIEQMSRMTTPQRLADFLLRLCPAGAGSCRIELPYEKALIAGRLGMKPESLSRALSRLKPLGVLVHRDEVEVQDLSRLRQFVELELDGGSD